MAKPTGPQKHKRLTLRYAAMTATVVNMPEPVTPYANWFSYVTDDFASENREIYPATPITRALFPHLKLRYVGDSGMHDQKIFHQIDLVNAEFIIRACHERTVEVYNHRLGRWEEELLETWLRLCTCRSSSMGNHQISTKSSSIVRQIEL